MKPLKTYSVEIVLLIVQTITVIHSQSKKIPHGVHNSSFNQIEPKVNIVTEYNVWISIECNNVTDYFEFHKLLISQAIFMKNETKTVKVNNCPLPDVDISLGLMFQELGIISYSQLLIKNDMLVTLNLAKQQLRNFVELKRLTIQLKRLSLLPKNIFEDTTLRNLTTLDLYTNVTSLPNDIFMNLENLRYLNMGHNLQSLGHGVFQKQSKLLNLNLSRNKLINISPDIFANGALIEAIQFQDNSLQTLPSNIFANLPTLAEINLNANEFQSLPAQLFENNSQLKEFVLTRSRVNIPTLPDNFLANLQNLTKVAMKCGLQYLPADVFYNSTNIREIILNNNILENIPSNLLKSQSELIYLDLSHNHMNEMPRGLFRNTRALKVLKLANNHLKTIERNSLTNLKNLEILDLSCNQLNSKDFRIKLDTSVNLKCLYLQNNSLSDLYVLLGHLPQNLRTLNLSFNEIRELLGKDLQLLHTDNLIFNLTHNQIKTIKLEDFGKQNVNIITDINDNPLKCDCKLVESMKYLQGFSKHLQFHTEYLECKEPNELKGRYVNEINKVELLCSLDTSFLKTYKCPEECRCWLRSYDNVLILNCSNKNLSQVPALQSLRDYGLKGLELNLTANQITSLPTSSLVGYANCTKLFLSNNQLTTIDKLQIPVNLTLLDLKQNNLHFVNEETLIYFSSNHLLQNISLSENQWQCDCSDSALLLYSATQIKNDKFTDASTMTCNNYPGTKYVYELQELCHRNEMILITTICSFVALVFFIFALSYKYQSNIKIWLYGHNICITYDDETGEKLYDAFISYSHKDEDFIASQLVPELENGVIPYKLCVHGRDFVVGEYIPDQIMNSISESSRVIVVMSRNFIQSEWAKLEFKEAHRATLTERKRKLIVIMYEDIGKDLELDRDLMLYLKMNTYLKWGDPEFWQKLRFAMPHKR